MKTSNFLITNIKFSIKTRKEMSLESIHKHCTALISNHCRLVGSKIVIRIPNQSKRIIVFPKKRGSPYQHINFTGINKFEEVEQALHCAAFYLNLEVNDLILLTVDNIWAKSDCLIQLMKMCGVVSLNLKLLLSVLKATLTSENVSIKFRPESFSAIVLRGFKATTLIYSTGAVVIVGAKEYSCLEKIIQYLSNISICQVSNAVFTH